MIVAIEGPSAAGKTTWCRSHFPRDSVFEAPENPVAPDLFADPAEVASFWVNYNIENWQRALALEHEHGIAFCDGDPLHLYYSWALGKLGALDRRLFAIESALYGRALEDRKIGFVDHVLWLEAPTGELRRRAQGDLTRRRKRHEVYLALVPWMKAWFQARERIMPETFHLLTNGLNIEGLQSKSPSCRYDAQLMNPMICRVSESAEPT